MLAGSLGNFNPEHKIFSPNLFIAFSPSILNAHINILLSKVYIISDTDVGTYMS